MIVHQDYDQGLFLRLSPDLEVGTSSHHHYDDVPRNRQFHTTSVPARTSISFFFSLTFDAFLRSVGGLAFF